MLFGNIDWYPWSRCSYWKQMEECPLVCNCYNFVNVPLADLPVGFTIWQLLLGSFWIPRRLIPLDLNSIGALREPCSLESLFRAALGHGCLTSVKLVPSLEPSSSCVNSPPKLLFFGQNTLHFLLRLKPLLQAGPHSRSAWLRLRAQHFVSPLDPPWLCQISPLRSNKNE